MSWFAAAPAISEASDSSSFIRINEVYARPPDKRAPLRFVEIENGGDEPVDLSGWRVVGDASFEIARGVILDAGGFAVLAEDPAALARLRGDIPSDALLLGPMRQGLSGENDFIRLLNGRDEEVDVWSITVFPPWPLEIVGQGASLERISLRGGSLDPANWRASLDFNGGTPGRPNDVASDRIPPFIWTVRLHPSHPAPLEPVTVEAVIDSEESFTTATVVLGTADGELEFALLCEELHIMENASVLDGRSARVWRGTVSGLTTGTIGLITAVAADTRDGAARPWPDYPQWHSEGFVAGEFETTATLAQWRFQVNRDRFRFLEEHNEVHGLSIPAGVFEGSRFHSHARVALRGRSSRGYPKKSFRIELPGGGRFSDGRDSIYLKCHWTDPSLIRERLAWSIDRCLGLPTFETSSALLWLNDSFYGVMCDVESPSKRWLKRAGLDSDGVFVRVDHLLYPLSGLPSNLRQDFSAVGDEIEALAAYDRMAFRVGATGVHDAAREIERLFDLDEFTNVMISHALLTDHDARTINRGYYLPATATGGDEARRLLVPWDLDLTFGRIFTQRGQFRGSDLVVDSPALDWRARCDNLVLAAYLSLPLRDRFFRNLEGAIGVCFQDDNLLPLIRKWSDEIGEWGEMDRKRWSRGGVPGEWKDQPGLLMEYINRRRDFLLTIERPQQYRSPIRSVEDTLFPPNSGLRDVESLWRNLASDWRMSFPVAETLRTGRWPALPLWAETAVASRQALNRVLPSLPFLHKTPAGNDYPSRFEPARAFTLATLVFLALWMLGAGSGEGRARRIGGAACRGLVAGVLWMSVASMLARTAPEAFPRPATLDWIAQPIALAAWMIALEMGLSAGGRAAWAWWAGVLALGALFFVGSFSPVAISVYQPGLPWLVALATGGGAALAARELSGEKKTDKATRRRFAGIVVGIGFAVAGAAAAYALRDARRPEALGVPSEFWGVAAGLFMAFAWKGEAWIRGFRGGLSALVVWHVAGDHVALALTSWDRSGGWTASLQSLGDALRIAGRLWVPAVAASLLVLPSALLRRSCRGGEGTVETHFRLRHGLAVLCLVCTLILVVVPVWIESGVQTHDGVWAGTTEEHFERIVRGSVLTKPPGFRKEVERAFDRWVDHPAELADVPSRNPLLAAQVLGSAGDGESNVDTDVARCAHTLLIHRDPWMLGEALAAHWAMGETLVADDAEWLRRELRKGRLDLDFPRAGRFENCLAHRLLDLIDALEVSTPPSGAGDRDEQP